MDKPPATESADDVYTPGRVKKEIIDTIDNKSDEITFSFSHKHVTGNTDEVNTEHTMWELSPSGFSFSSVDDLHVKQVTDQSISFQSTTQDVSPVLFVPNINAEINQSVGKGMLKDSVSQLPSSSKNLDCVPFMEDEDTEVLAGHIKIQLLDSEKPAYPFPQILNRLMLKHTPRKLLCTVCGKSFSKSGRLTEHMRTHTGEKPFSCKVCSKSFSQSGNLGKHMRVHTGEKPFSCTLCNKSFSQSVSLTVHTRIHTRDKPFSCTVCSKSFSKAESLTTHMHKHTGEKPFTCTVCSKSFSESWRLTKHKRTHNGEH